MGRPTKQGIDYFSLDCQFDDKTEMFLIEKGATGLAVLVSIWQMIYSNEGYYIQDNEDLYLLIKRKIDVSVNEVSECVNAALRRNLFNNELHAQYGILTSRAIQKRYFDAAKKKKSVEYCSEFVLISIDSYFNLVSSDGNPVNVAGNATKEKEEEKEKEKEEKEESSSSSGNADALPFSSTHVMNIWNAEMANTYATKKKILDANTRKRINQLTKTEFTTEEDWKNFFRAYKSSDFMMGKVDPPPGRRRFKLSLEFAIKQSNMTKLVEGHWHD
jgi:hypothetical protein